MQEDEERTSEEIWDELPTASKIAVKATDHSMAYNYCQDGELTPLGEGVVWWLVKAYSDIDYDECVEYLRAHARETIPNLPPDGSQGQCRVFNSQRCIVLREAQKRLGEVEG